MKKILIGAAGGSPSTNFIRSLRLMKEKVFIVGIDCNKYNLQRSEANEKILAPKARDKHYLNILNNIIDKYKIDFVYSQNDQEIEFLSEHREQIKAKMFLPAKKTVKICLDKFQSFKVWEKAGIIVPKTITLNTKEDLKKAFEVLGSKLWLRNIKGAAGKGSYQPKNFEDAANWINFQNGWGYFTAAEYLSADSITWSSIWHHGELIVAQSRKRLYWELSDRAPSGVTGITGAGITFRDPKFDELAIKAILAIDKTPHGIFSVDMTYNQQGIPNPTEINIGRFFTTHLFFTKAGLNMPEIFISLAYGEDYPKPSPKINPLKNNLCWIRGVDFEPILTDLQTIKNSEIQLKQSLRGL